MIARIDNVDRRGTLYSVHWTDDRGKQGTTVGSVANANVRALLDRAKREGVYRSRRDPVRSLPRGPRRGTGARTVYWYDSDDGQLHLYVRGPGASEWALNKGDILGTSWDVDKRKGDFAYALVDYEQGWQKSVRNEGYRTVKFQHLEYPPPRSWISSRDRRAPRSRRDPKRPTFAAARAELLAHLRAQGWDVKTFGASGPLKTPHATSPSGELRLWFKPQAVYFTSGRHHEMGNARSLWVDIRDESPSAIAAQAAKWEPGFSRDARRPRRRRT